LPTALTIRFGFRRTGTPFASTGEMIVHVPPVQVSIAKPRSRCDER
jgi:hypothetical protein